VVRLSCDLELEIMSGAAPGDYVVAVDSPAGAASGTVRLDVTTLLSRRRELSATVLASAVSSRAGLSALEQPVREVGRTLFTAVFAERVYGRYAASVQEAARRGEPLRVVLRLRAPELAGLPWEMMFDPDANEYLCQREPLVRYVESAQPSMPLPVKPPLRILGLVAAPRNLPRLDAAAEKQRLTDALAGLTARGQVELVWAPGGSWPALMSSLILGPWHVLHFVGHGGIDPNHSDGLLALEDDTSGQADLVSAVRFARLLHTSRPVPRLTVLNACQSGESAPDDLLSSTAATLVDSGISAAIAMQFAVTDPAAVAFARGFYQALARNNPVDEAVRIGRIAINGTSENTLEWLTPVLYLRTDDTRLFALAPEPEAQQPAAQRQSQVNNLHQQLFDRAAVADWTAVLALSDQLATLDPTQADPHGLATIARNQMRPEQGPTEKQQIPIRTNGQTVRPAPTTPPGDKSQRPKRAHRHRPLTITAVTATIALILAAAVLLPSLLNSRSNDSSPPSDEPTPTLEWRRIEDLEAPLDSPGVAAMNGEVWVVGGLLPLTQQRQAVATVQVFNPTQNKWRPETPLPVALDHAAVTTDGKRLYVIGGQTGPDGQKEVRQAVWMLDEDHTWKELDPLPEPRVAGAAAWDNHGQRLVFAGGFQEYRDGDEGPVADDVWILEQPHLKESRWRPIGTLTQPRQHLTAVADDQGHTWFHGGRDGNRVLGSIDVVTDDSITPHSDLNTPVNAPAAVWTEDAGVCLLGGLTENGNTTDKVDCGEKIMQLPEARAGAGATILAGSIYFVGGYTEPDKYTARVDVLALK
jgi:CHAT domain/Kelch motif/Galactose oxidase, central domain